MSVVNLEKEHQRMEAAFDPNPDRSADIYLDHFSERRTRKEHLDRVWNVAAKWLELEEPDGSVPAMVYRHLPIVGAFQTFLSDSNPAYSPLKNLLCSTISPAWGAFVDTSVTATFAEDGSRLVGEDLKECHVVREGFEGALLPLATEGTSCELNRSPHRRFGRRSLDHDPSAARCFAV
jgi:hypothetical protein